MDNDDLLDLDGPRRMTLVMEEGKNGSMANHTREIAIPNTFGRRPVPANWRGNTLVAGAVIFGIVAVTWKFGADREQWAHRPQPGEWYPSRRWSRQLIQWDKEESQAEQSKNQ
ncbi:hypothetical protein HC256_003629 [Beauveria bassiana]|nr:hypothetical protein HC256_003629 [Beauveria bassiana]